MSQLEFATIARYGIPINLGIAVIIGTAVAFIGEGIEYGISTGVLIGIMLGFFIQEGLLIQILSREANIDFQHRILNGDVTHKNRMTLLVTPIMVLLILGMLLAFLNNLATDSLTLVRILCVSAIIMFGVDPLFGLVDKGVLAIFGAAVVYIIILQAGFDGYDNMANSIAPVVGDKFAFSAATAVIAYLLLSARWTYYRLFCFNQSENLLRVFADTGLPLLLVLLPYGPTFLELLESIFLGV
ncbi:hypothetical protein OAC38_02210 [Candidatus Poseidoniaceae archaeon]|nr:hypothetical protein [Candidatus Poseidoniaceae archaeon]